MSRIILISGYRLIIVGLLLVAFTSLAYWQVRDHQFITCDDDMYVYENPEVRAGLTWEGVKWSFTAFHSANWHPLTWLSHLLDCQLYGMQPRGRRHIPLAGRGSHPAPHLTKSLISQSRSTRPICRA